MNQTQKELRAKRARKLLSVLSLIYFALCGLLLGILNLSMPSRSGFLPLLLDFLVIYLSFLLHICVHELGHLLFGLLSGYRFCSIRFWSLMLYRTDDGLRLGRFSIAGTGGQCIMLPPEKPLAQIPTSLYNWGGVIMNVVLSLAIGALFFLPAHFLYLKLFAVMQATVGIFMALTNGIPIEVMSNDGYNALMLDRDLKAKKSFLLGFRIIAALQAGQYSKDFPAEWFDWTFSPENSAFVNADGVQQLCHLTALQRFEEAYALSCELRREDCALSLHHQMIVNAERFFCMMLLRHPEEELRGEFQQLTDTFHTMRRDLSTQRILYTYHTLITRDTAAAQNAVMQFNKLAKNHPYPTEAEEERELMYLAYEKALHP